jgi:hypothetical protein
MLLLAAIFKMNSGYFSLFGVISVMEYSKNGKWAWRAVVLPTPFLQYSSIAQRKLALRLENSLSEKTGGGSGPAALMVYIKPASL